MLTRYGVGPMMAKLGSAKSLSLAGCGYHVTECLGAYTVPAGAQ